MNIKGQPGVAELQRRTRNNRWQTVARGRRALMQQMLDSMREAGRTDEMRVLGGK